MNVALPIRKQTTVPQKVLVDRQAILDVVRIYEELRFDLGKAVGLMESGRIDAAATLLRQARGKLG